jgi:hypothetical protein
MTKGRTRTENIPVEELREILAYDPETGVCTWKVPRGTKIRPGMVAGCKNSLGYYFIGINGRRYYTHRIAFALTTGAWPTALVDHIDMDPGNNAWANLRLANKSENMRNRGKQKNNTTGAKGVTKADSGKFVVEVWLNRKKHYIGRFTTIGEAETAYESAAATLHGEFARSEA